MKPNLTNQAGEGVGTFRFAELAGPVRSSQRFPPEDEILKASVKRDLLIPANPLRTDPIKSVKVLERWTVNGVYGQLISYPSTWGGPDIQAYVLRPSHTVGELPAVLALHCHGNLKKWGKEKIADGPCGSPPELGRYRERGYGGVAFANELALQGFTVMVPDTFMWGSRAVTAETMPGYPEYFLQAGRLLGAHPRFSGKFEGCEVDAGLTDQMAADNYFEGELEKIITARTGRSLAAVVCNDDRISLKILKSLPGVKQSAIGAIGLSGGGNRVGLLRAAGEHLDAAVIAGMMCTYSALLDYGDTWKHSWMLFPKVSFQGQLVEWPDLVSLGAPNPLLCLFNSEDPLFSLSGQQHGDLRLKEIYAAIGSERAYTGWFYNGGHKFDRQMQQDAFQWLMSVLG